MNQRLLPGLSLLPLACLVISISVLGLLGCGDVASRKESDGNLRKIIIAMHSYQNSYEILPIAGVPEGEGPLGISWRARLPGYDELQVIGYKRRPDWEKPVLDWQQRVKWNEAWDSPANQELHDKMPSEYGFPGGKPGETVYLGFTMEPDRSKKPPLITAFGDGRKGAKHQEIRDGTANTMVIVEADRDRAVPWMKPADLAFDPQNPKAGVGGFRTQGFLAAFADGSVKFISNKTSDDVMRQLVLANDGGGAQSGDYVVPRNP